MGDLYFELLSHVSFICTVNLICSVCMQDKGAYDSQSLVEMNSMQSIRTNRTTILRSFLLFPFNVWILQIFWVLRAFPLRCWISKSSPAKLLIFRPVSFICNTPRCFVHHALCCSHAACKSLMRVRATLRTGKSTGRRTQKRFTADVGLQSSIWDPHLPACLPAPEPAEGVGYGTPICDDVIQYPVHTDSICTIGVTGVSKWGDEKGTVSFRLVGRTWIATYPLAFISDSLQQRDSSRAPGSRGNAISAWWLPVRRHDRDGLLFNIGKKEFAVFWLTTACVLRSLQ
jgi:hypothetical protein